MARSVCDNAYVTKSGYRIVAITRACQARDRGSTPLTRSKEPKDPDFLGLLVFLGKREEKGVSRMRASVASCV